MVFGGIGEERIILNENTLWSGGPQGSDRENAWQSLPEIRRLLLEGKNADAEALVNRDFIAKGEGSNRGRGRDVPYGSYQVLGNLHLKFGGGESDVSNYRRQLDLKTAVARVTYTQNGINFTREVFVSAPDQSIIIRLTADRPKSISFDASIDRPERFFVQTVGSNALLMSGQLKNGADENGMKYAARLRILNKGGEISAIEKWIHVERADEAILLVTAATDYQGFAGRQTNDPLSASLADMNRASAKSYQNLLAAHVKDYQKYINRVHLDFGETNQQFLNMATPERLANFGDGTKDPNFAALYFQFGRYLLISSSRPGGLPANLQGLWVEGTNTLWSADWHLNINVQMNYWLAENTNLSELHEPLFRLTESLQKPGAVRAKKSYSARGWVAHTLTNLWGFTSPGESASWGSTNTGSGWLCQHLWEHYLYTKDKNFLRWAYPIMKAAALFYTDVLIEEPTHKWFVTAPSNSPENSYKIPGHDKPLHTVMGPTIDEQIIRYLFGAVIEASAILKMDQDFRHELIERRARLTPTRVGHDRRVMEWLEEYEEPEPTHRHVSHLWGLYPGDEITPDDTPQLADAARKTLEQRGDISTGWSLAHKINLWARLGDGNHAYKLLCNLLSPIGSKQKIEGVQFNGGSYDNLFDAHPPFQIDGNFGATAGIAEMLLQSHNHEIRLLAALPAAWVDGRVTGLCARGGFGVDIAWEEGRLSGVTIRSNVGGVCRLRYGKRTLRIKTQRDKSYCFDGRLKLLRKCVVKNRLKVELHQVTSA
jgi:alpha-L-fucosidase 2